MSQPEARGGGMSRLDRWLALDLSQLGAATSATSSSFRTTSRHSARTAAQRQVSLSVPSAVSQKSQMSQGAIAESRETAPAAWLEDVARLGYTKAPEGISESRWRRIAADTIHFLDTWGAQAAALGWSPLDLFGVHRSRP